LSSSRRLPTSLRVEDGQPRDITARPRKACDEPARNRIASGSEDNGEGPGRLLGGQGGGCVSGHDDINLERNQFGRKSGEPLELSLGISIFNHDVAALDVTEVAQSLTEGLGQVGASGLVGRQVAYSSDLGRLLGLGGERRKSESNNEDDREADQPHCCRGV
jgi:hypothetical protein